MFFDCQYFGRFVNYHVEGRGQQLGYFHLLGVRRNVQRGGSSVTELYLANDDSIRAGSSQASFAFGSVHFGAFAIVVVRGDSLFINGRVNNVRRVLIGDSASCVVRVNFHCHCPIGL